MDERIGKWVAVSYSYSVAGLFSSGGGIHAAFGILESEDDAAILVRQANGETLYLPIETIRTIQVIAPPEPIPGGTLLRPAGDSASESMLVRPAESAGPETLLRQTDAPSDE